MYKDTKIQRHNATKIHRYFLVRERSLPEPTVECAHETNDNIKLQTDRQTDRDEQMDRQRRTSHDNLHDTLSFQWLLLLFAGLGEAPQQILGCPQVALTF